MSDSENEETVVERTVINVTQNDMKSKKKEKPVGLSGAMERANAERSRMKQMQESIRKDPAVKQKRDESILQWFDRSVEDELQKRRYDSQPPKLDLKDCSGAGHPLMVESSVSNIALEQSLRGERDTDLFDAVDKYAKAEAMVAFEGAIRAAEQAAASAPPGQAEEAAVAGAKGYQAELVNVVKQKVPGVKPIEVVGYVGITRPFKPKKS